MRIITNNQWHQFKYGDEVPKKILESDYDHLTLPEEYDGFLQYRGCWYHISDFMRITYELEHTGYNGVCSESFFSGVLIKVSEDGEEYQIARYLS